MHVGAAGVQELTREDIREGILLLMLAAVMAGLVCIVTVAGSGVMSTTDRGRNVADIAARHALGSQQVAIRRSRGRDC